MLLSTAVFLQPLSAADYVELCRHFDTVFMQDLPRMTLETRSEARRFITMIDTFYDHKVVTSTYVYVYRRAL